jgi:hypothetical protein
LGVHKEWQVRLSVGITVWGDLSTTVFPLQINFKTNLEIYTTKTILKFFSKTLLKDLKYERNIYKLERI